MFGSKRMLRVLAPLAVVCSAFFVASCNGSNNSTPSPSSSSLPATVSYSVTLTTIAGSIPLPAVSGGNAATLNYVGSSASPSPSPFPSAGIALATTSQVAPPTNAPVPTSARRQPLARTNATAALYVTFTLGTAVPASIFSGEVLNLGSGSPTNVPYFVELDDLTTNTYINTYPGSAANNGIVTFANANGFVPSTNLANVGLTTTDTYLLQFYYLGAGATPSPSPSPSGSAPAATPTPVVVSTTEPLAAAQSFSLPVTSGGFIANISVPATAGGASLTTSGTSGLPGGISGVGTTNSYFPLYSVGFTSSAAVALTSPQITLQLPSNLATGNPIFGALCTASACPLDAQDLNVAPSTSSGSITFGPGAFKGFTSVGSQPIYVVIYSSRQTPAGNVASPVTVAAGGVGTIPLPAITPNGGAGSYASTVTLAGLSAATTVTVAAQTGLFTGMSAIIPNTQTVFYVLSITATPAVTSSGFGCGSTGCSVVALTVPPDNITAATGKTYEVEECSASVCPVASSSPSPLMLNGSVLNVSPAQLPSAAVPFDPVKPVYLVFFYQ